MPTSAKKIAAKSRSKKPMRKVQDLSFLRPTAHTRYMAKKFEEYAQARTRRAA